MIDLTDEFKQDVIIKSRKQIEMSGVLDVNSFDEHEIVVQTSSSCASIDGENLKIDRFNSQNGELVVNGTINGIFYYNKEPQKKKKGITSFFK